MKKDEKRAQKERRLLDAAFDLFLENGMECTTIEAVAKRAGLAKGTVYLYFKDKQDIAEKLVQLYANRLLNSAWDKCYRQDCDGITLVSDIAGEVIDELARDKRLIRFIHNNLSFAMLSRVTAGPAGKPPVNVLDTVIKKLESGGVKLREPRIAVFMMLELIIGACYQSVIYENPLPIAQLKPHLFAAIKGIAVYSAESADEAGRSFAMRKINGIT